MTDLLPSRVGSHIYDSILVVVDRFTKIAYYVLYRKDITTEGLAESFLREVVCLHSVPCTLVSDCRLILTSKF